MSADKLLDHAVERQWVAVRDDLVLPGIGEPVPVMPVVPRSRLQRAVAWGPPAGWNGDR